MTIAYFNTTDFPLDAQALPVGFPRDRGAFPPELELFDSATTPPHQTIVASARPLTAAAGPSRLVQVNDTGLPVITLDDYENMGDFFFDVPAKPRKKSKGKGKMKMADREDGLPITFLPHMALFAPSGSSTQYTNPAVPAQHASYSHSTDQTASVTTASDPTPAPDAASTAPAALAAAPPASLTATQTTAATAAASVSTPSDQTAFTTFSDQTTQTASADRSHPHRPARRILADTGHKRRHSKTNSKHPLDQFRRVLQHALAFLPRTLETM